MVQLKYTMDNGVGGNANVVFFYTFLWRVYNSSKHLQVNVCSFTVLTPPHHCCNLLWKAGYQLLGQILIDCNPLFSYLWPFTFEI